MCEREDATHRQGEAVLEAPQIEGAALDGGSHIAHALQRSSSLFVQLGPRQVRRAEVRLGEGGMKGEGRERHGERDRQTERGSERVEREWREPEGEQTERPRAQGERENRE